jgi:phosphotransferase system  glucose/maltose/N-acetylglucosamine-specific IIC component
MIAISSTWRRLRTLWHAEFLSPKDLVRRAAVIVAVFALAHLLGLREYTSFLNGTIGAVGISWQAAATRGLIYVFLYLAVVLLVPILLIAASLIVVARRFHASRHNSQSSNPQSNDDRPR